MQIENAQFWLNNLVSNTWVKLVQGLLDSVLVKPAQTLGEVPAQQHRQEIDEAKKSKGVEQHHSVRQERQSCGDNTRQIYQHTKG